MSNREFATQDNIPEIVPNSVPGEKISNIVIYVDFGDYGFQRFICRPFDDPEDESQYLVDITNYVENNPGCLIADDETQRVFIKEELIDEAIKCDKSLPPHCKRPPRWEWNSIIEQQEASKCGVIPDYLYKKVKKYAGIITNNNDSDSINTDISSDSTSSADEKLTNDVDTIIRAVKNHWNFAVDQNGSRICSLKDNNSSSWYVGVEQVIDWATKYKINDKRFINQKAYRVLSLLIDDVSKESTNKVVSGKKFVKLHNSLYVYNGSTKYYKVDKNGIKEDDISNCPIAFISDLNESCETYEIDTSGTEKDFFNTINSLNMDKDSLNMLKTWLISVVMNTESDTPIILFRGLKGTGKSTSMKMIGRILDSDKSPRLTPMPYSMEKLQYYAAGSWLKLFDNIRKLPYSYQDVLSVAATGGVIPMRKLYTTNSMEMFSISGPVVLSTVHDMKLSSDLLDRIIVISSKDRIKNAQEISISTESVLKARGGMMKVISRLLNYIDEDFINKCGENTKGRFPAFYYTLKALEDIYPQEFSGASQGYGAELRQRDMESVPEWIEYIYENSITFSGSSSEIYSYLKEKIPHIEIPSKYRMLSEWNEYDWYWSEKLESEYKRMKSKRIWTVNNR